MAISFGQLGQNMGWGRKSGQRYVGFFKERNIERNAPSDEPMIKSVNQVAVLTYREIFKAVSLGSVEGVALCFARAMFGF